jgi:hypothetical protein
VSAYRFTPGDRVEPRAYQIRKHPSIRGRVGTVVTVDGTPGGHSRVLVAWDNLRGELSHPKSGLLFHKGSSQPPAGSSNGHPTGDPAMQGTVVDNGTVRFDGEAHGIPFTVYVRADRQQVKLVLPRHRMAILPGPYTMFGREFSNVALEPQREEVEA